MRSLDQRPDLLAALTDGVVSLANADEWRRHLELQTRFHRYSFGNVVLIAAQRPDATRVAGYRTWEKVGRRVRKGERALWILAPMVARRPASSGTGPARSDTAGDGDGDRVVRGFRPVPVFDVAQTEGEDLPQVCHLLSGEDPGRSFDRLCDVAALLDYRVEDARLPSGTNGDCTVSERRIRVEVGNAPAQRVKTLAHELGHALLHEGHHDRRLAELEAESVAFVVCRHLLIDSGRYTFGYVATWAGGTEQAAADIRSSCTRIQRAAEVIIGAIEDEGAPAAGPSHTAA